MKLAMCAVWDSALQAYMRPFFSPTRAGAQRAFGDEVNRRESEMHGHPEDYELHFLGEWDDHVGTVVGYEKAVAERLVVRAKDIFKGDK